MLERLGRFCARHPWPVVASWFAALILLGVVEAGHHGTARDQLSIPGTQSQKALDLLGSSFPSAAGAGATVVFHATSGTLEDPAHQGAVTEAVQNLKAIPGVASASSPFDPVPTGLTMADGRPQVQSSTLDVNADRTVGYASVQFGEQLRGIDQADEWFAQMQKAAQPATDAGLDVEYAGAVTDLANQPPPGISKYSEDIGLLCAVLILLFALGSVTSMAVPILVAMTAVTASKDIVNILMGTFTIGSVAPVLGSMIGLGVGIDYSLFIVTRFRQNLRDGMEVPDAAGKAMATSGSAVLFAGVSVCIAMCGLYLVRIPYVTQLGFIAALFVIVTVSAALTLVPAVLGALGHRIDSLRIHRRDENIDVHRTLSARWARETSRHPVVFASVSLVLLLSLAAPVRSMQLGFTDDGDLSRELTQYRAYELLTTNFGAGVNGPLLLAVDLPDVNSGNAAAVIDAFGKLDAAVQATPGVARVSIPVPNKLPSTTDAGSLPTAAIVEVVPTTAPNDDATADLVRELRTSVVPDTLHGTALDPAHVYVGGPTAILIDLTAAIRARLPVFILAVILGAFLLLMMVFRSLFVPFKAAIMNVLSIGGAYGVIVAIFQWGWGKDLIGLHTTVPVMAFVPVMMFAVLFGLSMDYEVFLLSRIREEYGRSGDSRQSVVTGLAETARVISAAALIMISVFLSFVPNPDPTVKMIGLGMAVAVFIDATIVRMILVPSTMELAGRINWWLPRGLDRLLPHIDVE